VLLVEQNVAVSLKLSKHAYVLENGRVVMSGAGRGAAARRPRAPGLPGRRWRHIRRHVAQIEKHCARRDLACRPRQRQALLHWAYDSRLI
jgi:hypothetical protein